MNIFKLINLLFCIFIITAYGRAQNDTNAVTKENKELNPSVDDNSVNENNEELKTSTEDNSAKNDNNDFKTSGVSVSPAHFHLKMKPGDVKTYSITVRNDTKKKNSFKVNTYDFNMDRRGKSNFIPSGTGKYSLSKWMNIFPTFIELAAGEKKEVNFTVSIPTDSSANKAAWSIIMIEQEEPKKILDPDNKSDKTIALGIIPTFAFGIYVYQNPPNVTTNSIEITNFSKISKDSVNTINIEAGNMGTGIAYCTAYVDLTNLSTGQQKRLLVKKFTIVPEVTREFSFTLPKTLEEGKYLAVGVLDYKGSEEIQAAKMKFVIN
jgi:hypothetical protein